MRKHFGDTYLYLHETIDLGGSTTDQFSQGFDAIYLPLMQGQGARLYSIWESTPFNAHWPQVTIIWEVDDFSAYAAIGAAHARDGTAAAHSTEWRDVLAGLGATGEGRLMYPGQFNRPLEQLQQEKFSASVVIQEIMTTKPGQQQTYIQQLERLYVPWSERTGKLWLGSFVTYFRFNEVIHYWALEGGWDGFANHYPSWKGEPPAEITTWMTVAPSMRDGWEDSILQALSSSPLI